ncbi:Uu.00g137740.m01.CDS01 [Anthostomella pinea]|uniref:Uu.00g137740.m01.CDS01 n=1 Tax=Anthostomella pinea TaxID=933095 RepID=A0AAI8YL05_9PEZI|nr:Uu.00g137740.m01.CDS01 [Anthostomella pinea]
METITSGPAPGSTTPSPYAAVANGVSQGLTVERDNTECLNLLAHKQASDSVNPLPALWIPRRSSRCSRLPRLISVDIEEFVFSSRLSMRLYRFALHDAMHVGYAQYFVVTAFLQWSKYHRELAAEQHSDDIPFQHEMRSQAWPSICGNGEAAIMADFQHLVMIL